MRRPIEQAPTAAAAAAAQEEEKVLYLKGTKQTLAEIWHPW